MGIRITCQSDACAAAGVSKATLERRLLRYPFPGGKPNGRWNVSLEIFMEWWDGSCEQEATAYHARQRLRHPRSRRMRPEEPPEFSGIKGR